MHCAEEHSGMGHACFYGVQHRAPTVAQKRQTLFPERPAPCLEGQALPLEHCPQIASQNVVRAWDYSALHHSLAIHLLCPDTRDPSVLPSAKGHGSPRGSRTKAL
uniref:Uncharacterized protein n=1 Tax=Eutreptiella gymnastica TaxID=73025 RepID=A0A7S1JFM0_9EUGL|mmetsp:Transcript_93171/g.161512  ORF Transcript_93171/g.161512 Transcript_93171/m.161512 type:complete len:105 (+) Transcript_93171:54-368(+)